MFPLNIDQQSQKMSKCVSPQEALDKMGSRRPKNQSLYNDVGRCAEKERCARHCGNTEVWYPTWLQDGMGYHRKLSGGEERNVSQSLWC